MHGKPRKATAQRRLRKASAAITSLQRQKRSECVWDGRDRKSAGSESPQHGIVAEEGIAVRKGSVDGNLLLFLLLLTRKLNIASEDLPSTKSVVKHQDQVDCFKGILSF